MVISILEVWSQIEFDTQFEILMDPQGYTGVTEEGFVSFSLVDRIVEFIKSFFGGTDHASEERIQAAAIKFLYYGETHNYVTDRHPLPFDFPRSLFFSGARHCGGLSKKCRMHHFQKDTESSSEFYGRLPDSSKIIIYTETPLLFVLVFGPRMTTRPALDAKTLFSFGDAPSAIDEKSFGARRGPEPQRSPSTF